MFRSYGTKGLLEDSDIAGHQQAGVVIGEGADPIIKNCRCVWLGARGALLVFAFCDQLIEFGGGDGFLAVLTQLSVHRSDIFPPR